MNKVSQNLINQAISIEISARFRPLLVKWCKWNSKTITGDDFARLFSKVFTIETLQAWNQTEGNNIDSDLLNKE